MRIPKCYPGPSSLLLTLAFLLTFASPPAAAATSTTPSSSTTSSSSTTEHITGAFGAYNPTSKSAIKKLGMNSAMNYVSIADGLDNAHLRLSIYAAESSRIGIKLIDDIPDQLIRRYHEDWNLTKLKSDMQKHMNFIATTATVRNNLSGYWMIDDWYSDFGAAKEPLKYMTGLIRSTTPDLPAICGFTGNTTYGGSVSGYAQFTANFSSEGCDMIGIYMYPYGTNKAPMTNLPIILQAFKNAGWDSSKTPLVGIPQSYGGLYGYSVPTAAQVRAETAYFCQNGAKHILYYNFNSATNGSTNTGIQQGIVQGLADCQAMW